MPYRRNYGMSRYRRRYARRSYGRKPLRGTVRRRFMPATLYRNRMQQMDTRTMYFSVSNIILGPEPNTNYRQAAYRARNLYNTTTLQWQIPELENLVQVYDQYQVRAIKVTWHPMNKYSGGAVSSAANLIEPYVLRGNICSVTDQRFRDPVQNATAIEQLTNFASFRMHDANRRFTRSLYRPRSDTRWGECTDITVVTPNRRLDSWDGAIFILQNNIVANNPVEEQELWYAVYTIKITFRGRRSPL